MGRLDDDGERCSTEDGATSSPDGSRAAALPTRRRLWRAANGRVRTAWRVSIFLLCAQLLGIAYSPLAAALWPRVGGRFGLDDALRGTGACALLVLASVLTLRIVDREARPLCALGLDGSGVRAALPAGLVGAGLIVGVFSIEWMMGWLAVAQGSGGAGTVAVGLVALLVGAVLEELVFRGYAFQALTQGIGARSSIAVMSLVFGISHNTNPEATQLGLINSGGAGVLLSLTYLRWRSLWPPIGLHFGWNAMLGPVLGIPVSGLGFEATVLVGELTARGERLRVFTGGGYGPEGGLLLSALLLPLLVWCGRALRRSDRSYESVGRPNHS